MSMKNSTENGSHEAPRCFLFEVVSSSDEDYMYPIHIVTALLNGIFAVSATLGNSLIIYVIWNHTFLHTPSNALLCCLALSDFVVGLIAQPAFVAHKIGELIDNFHLYCTTRVTVETLGHISCGVSTLTLTAISVERYLALRLNLRYFVIVTNSRIFGMVGLFWSLFTVAAISKNFVEKVNSLYGTYLLIILLSSFTVISVSYVFIFRCVRRHQKRIAAELPRRNAQELPAKTRSSFSLLRYKKSTYTMIYILGVYLLFYLPFIAVMAARTFLGYTDVIKGAYVCTSTLVLINSSANPLIYCWRITDIRIPVKQTLEKMFQSLRTPASCELGRSTKTVNDNQLSRNPQCKFRQNPYNRALNHS